MTIFGIKHGIPFNKSTLRLISLLVFGSLACSVQAGESLTAGGACSGNANGFDWDTGWDCVSSAYQRAPLYVGSASAYTCGVSTEGLIQWTGSLLQYCNSTPAWTTIGTTSTITLGTSATVTSPQISGDATSGFYTAAAGEVDVSISGSEIVSWTGTGENIAKGSLSIGGITTLSLPLDSQSGGSIAIGSSALASQSSLSATFENVAIGYQAMGLGTMTTAAIKNVAIGYLAMAQATQAADNVAVGWEALQNISTGGPSVAVGYEALQGSGGALLTGAGNVAVGSLALQLTQGAGNNNTGVGYEALQNLTTNSFSTAVGSQAGVNATGQYTTAIGYQALEGSSLTGNNNTAVGASALSALSSTAANNTALGYSAGSHVTTGSSNVIIGYQVASTTLTTGSNNILIGTSSSVDTAAGGTSNFISIGNLYEGDASIDHIVFNGTAPSISSGNCGTGTSGTVVGNDNIGTITVGTSPGGTCTLTFHTAWTTAPVCFAVDQTTANLMMPGPTTSTLVITGTLTASDVISYECIGYAL